MRKSSLSIIVSLMVLLNSCITTNKGYQSATVITRDIMTNPIKVDVEVNEKERLEGKSESQYLLFFQIKGNSHFADGITYSTDANHTGKLEKIKSSAAYEALKGGGYDLLVHPTYVVKYKNVLGIYKQYVVTVRGYGGNYKNFRSDK